MKNTSCFESRIAHVVLKMQDNKYTVGVTIPKLGNMYMEYKPTSEIGAKTLFTDLVNKMVMNDYKPLGLVRAFAELVNKEDHAVYVQE